MGFCSTESPNYKSMSEVITTLFLLESLPPHVQKTNHFNLVNYIES